MRIFPEKIKRALKSTLFGLMLAASVTVQSLGAQALGTDSTAAKEETVESPVAMDGVYGLSLIHILVRMEEDGIRRYVHLGTGNYNDSTAKLYTDCGILTCNPQIGEDATAVFNMLSGYSEPLAWNRLSVAPLWLRARCLRMIRRETENALAGREAHIMAKMNSLCDKEIITALYEASHAGVKVELVIRGICCLRAGVPGPVSYTHLDVYKRQTMECFPSRTPRRERSATIMICW